MSRKRRRTAWTSLSESKPRLFATTSTYIRPQTATTPYIITIHPPPSATPKPSIARSLLPAMNQTSDTPTSEASLSEDYVEATDVVPATLPDLDRPHLPSETPPPLHAFSAEPPHSIPENPDPDFETPLILTRAEIRAAQIALSLTPSTPPSILFLPKTAERQARRLLSSNPALQTEERPPRRLSLVSTVTPIPLLLDSPQPLHHHHSDIPLPIPPTDSRNVHHPLASPITPFRDLILPASDLHPPASAPRPPHVTDVVAPSTSPPPDANTPSSRGISPAAHSANILVPPPIPDPPARTHTREAPVQKPDFLTTKPAVPEGNPLESDAAHIRTASKTPDTPACAESLFRTAKGSAVPLPKSHAPSSKTGILAPKTPRVDRLLFTHDLADSMFTTGKGAAVPIPKQPPHQPSASLFTTGNGAAIKTPKVDRFLFAPQSGPSLFTTGKGAPVPIPKAPSLFTTGKGTPVAIPKTVTPLFTTGKGVPLITPDHQRSFQSLKHTAKESRVKPDVPSNPLSTTARKQVRIAKSNPLHTPRTPITKHAGLRRSLFRDQTSVGHTPTSRPTSLPRPRRGASKATPRMKGTPFKRPRQILRKGADRIAKKKTAPASVPTFSVPRLSTMGAMIPEKGTAGAALNRVRPSRPSYQFVFSVGCLERSLHHIFEKRDFGDVDLLPSNVRNGMHFDELSAFGVGTCISWIEKMFPSVSKKPATTVGSAAWTRLSYALAVWKLGRLSYSGRTHFKKSNRSFLSAANVTRELLRRISVEWHMNRQPHLLRIMRQDSSPASHVVLIIADLQQGAHDQLIMTVSDGWYVAYATVDKILEGRIRSGRLRIGDKVHLSGSSLRSNSALPRFVFGEGDELGNGFLSLCANGLRKQRGLSTAKLGLQRRPLHLRSTQSILENGGVCPGLLAVVLRSYPIFYMETVQESGEDSDARPKFICRRQDGEDEARASFEDTVRQNAQAGTSRTSARNRPVDMSDTPSRKVCSVLELQICGIDDKSSDTETRKFIRMYNPVEETVSLLSDGQVIQITQLSPKSGAWTCAPANVITGLDGCDVLKSAVEHDDHKLPRDVCSTSEIENGRLCSGGDFDGVFSLLHVTDCEKDSLNRFAYMVDELGNDNTMVLALELVGDDVKHLPIALRVKGGTSRKFPLVVLRDAKFAATDVEHGLVHAMASLRTDISTTKAYRRKQKNIALASRVLQVESKMKGKNTQLEILKEAVLAFASGNRRSIGAYFTGTQDM